MIHVSVEAFTSVMEVLGLVFSVLGAFVIFFLFMPKKNEGKYTGKLEKLYDFLNFRCYLIEDVLKFFYVLAACLCTGIGLFMSLTIVELTRGLLLLVVGNLAARLIFEFLMMLMKACRNLGEIGKETQRPVYREIPLVEAAVTEEKVPEKKVTEEKVPEEKIFEEKVSEEKVPEEKVPEETRPEPVKETVILKKAKIKVCPACGEKCSSKFAFCNMCGTKLS